MFQYGSDEFGQDSPRYTSPKAAALYADPYYIGKHKSHVIRQVWRRNKDPLCMYTMSIYTYKSCTYIYINIVY